MAEASKDGIEEMQENVAQLRSAEGTNDVVNGSYEDEPEGNEDSDLSPVELKAMEKGWHPDKDDMPEGKEWISADEFMRNERFFHEIKKLKREINTGNKNFEALKEHHEKIELHAREKLIKQLKIQKKEALDEGEHDVVVELDDQIAELKNAPTEVIKTDNTDTTLFDTWVEENPWYANDGDMRETADELGVAYAAKNQGAPANEVFAHVNKRIKQLYPDRFTPKSVKRSSAPAVESANTGRGSKGKPKAPKYSARDLNETQLRVMRNFVRSGALTEEQYIEDLVRIGELS